MIITFKMFYPLGKEPNRDFAVILSFYYFWIDVYGRNNSITCEKNHAGALLGF